MSARGLALCIGINAVDRTHYLGTFPDLNCAEFDALDMSDMFNALAFSAVEVLLGPNASRRKVMNAFGTLSDNAVAGDLVVITYSGHGSQVPDSNSNESDGQDETWCLHDSQLLDDEIFVMLSKFRPGVRVLIVSDSCHSGTVFEVSLNEGMMAPDIEADVITRDMPKGAAMLTNHAHSRQIKARQAEVAALGFAQPEADLPIAASVRLLSACTDGQLAFEDVSNGHFTSRMKVALSQPGGFTGNYEAFRAAVQNLMRSDQSPELRSLGAANPAFDGQRPFQI